MKKLLTAAVSAAMLTGVATQASAQVSQAEWEAFKKQFEAMSERVDALEAENARLRGAGFVTVEDLDKTNAEVATLAKQNSATSWAERLSWKGDFRYRYEYIDIEDRDSRERNRIRARFGLTAQLPGNTEVGAALASGGDDPVSSNQTLGGGGSSKEVRLDKAYFKWNATEDLYLQAGKYSNPLYTPQKSALLWDSDWRPEGISAGWGGEHLFANLLGNWLESDSKDGEDEFAWGVQAGTRFGLGDSAALTAALAYYDFPTKGNSAYFDDDFFGNSNENGVYLFNYEMVEVGADVSLSLFDMPFSVFGNYVQNQDADDYDTGWQAGVKLGKASGKGTWQVDYRYQDLEADAVLGLLSDSDFAGGGTDGKGHRLSAAYGINKQWNVGFTWFINNEAGEKNLADEGGAVDYDRIQLDTVFKY